VPHRGDGLPRLDSVIHTQQDPGWALLSLCSIAFVAGCQTAPTDESSTLAYPENWALLDADTDPYDDRPEYAECPDWAFGVEDEVFEVRTDGCRYGTFVQDSLLNVPANATLRISIGHLGLFSREPAEAHVSLTTSTTELVELRIPIPSEEALHIIEVQVDDDLPAGSPLYFHLHNHGSNTWRLLSIELLRRDR
jgi:hypothetical protein